MVHLRTQIRQKLKEKLNNIFLGGNLLPVLFDDPSNIQPNRLPCVLINSTNEDIAQNTFSGSYIVLTRDYDVRVQALVKSNINLQDKIDEVALQIEQAIGKDKSTLTLDGIVKNITLKSVEFDFDEVQETQFAMITNVYTIKYMTTQANPTQHL